MLLVVEKEAGTLVKKYYARSASLDPRTRSVLEHTYIRFPNRLLCEAFVQDRIDHGGIANVCESTPNRGAVIFESDSNGLIHPTKWQRIRFGSCDVVIKFTNEYWYVEGTQ